MAGYEVIVLLVVVGGFIYFVNKEDKPKNTGGSGSGVRDDDPKGDGDTPGGDPRG